MAGGKKAMKKVMKKIMKKAAPSTNSASTETTSKAEQSKPAAENKMDVVEDSDNEESSSSAVAPEELAERAAEELAKKTTGPSAPSSSTTPAAKEKKIVKASDDENEGSAEETGDIEMLEEEDLSEDEADADVAGASTTANAKNTAQEGEQDDDENVAPDEEKVVVEEFAKDPYLLKDAEYIKTDPNWKNKQRTLLFSTRGISGQHRHLIDDLKKLLPHHKVESKVEKSQDFTVVNEIAELKSCNNVCFFEARKHQDLYLHVARVPCGPTVKFQVLNIHTSGEVRLSGNCLQYSRPLLTFDAPFDAVPHLKLIKELFVQTFGTPRNHPKSKPFHDQVLSFYYADEKIWARHYQISPLTDADANDPEKQTLTEIGPRFVLDPIWILQGSFSGQKIYHNNNFSTPTAVRRENKQKLGVRAKVRAEQDEQTRLTNKKLERAADPTEAIFEEYS